MEEILPDQATGIRANELKSGQVYFIAYWQQPAIYARTYISSQVGASKKQPVFYFQDEHDRAYHAYTPDLLAYHRTEKEALVLLIENMERTVAILKEQLNNNSNGTTTASY